jgi:hypothetical protein
MRSTTPCAPLIESALLNSVPGDIDAVNSLKVELDKGHEVDIHAFRDPNVPASTLKLWFRELARPVIPDSLYELCIQVRVLGFLFHCFGS